MSKPAGAPAPTADSLSHHPPTDRRIAASRLVIRDGALLCQRRGTLNPADQSMGDYAGRAPERRGIWAFPFPYYDDFFGSHKFEDVLPQHLRQAALKSLYLQMESYGREDPRSLALEEERNRRWAEREGWLRAHSSAVMPVRRFWWRGDIYTRFTPDGSVIAPAGSRGGWILLGLSDWQRGARKLERAAWQYGTDEMEIFLAPNRGRVIGHQSGQGPVGPGWRTDLDDRSGW
jgi:hypothetical protein